MLDRSRPSCQIQGVYAIEVLNLVFGGKIIVGKVEFAALAPVFTKSAGEPRYLLLILDEAHRLPPDIFDQLRFLLNDQMDSASLLTLVLLGQPDLAQLLRFAPYQALLQRIAVRYHLRPFDLQETIAYIKHHLRVAGSQNPIFSDGFLSGVYDHTKGVPRQINNLCRSALLLGATENKQILDESDLKRVIHDQDGQLS